MKSITFKDIYKAGRLVLENELYLHVHNPEMLLQYDSNFIRFKIMPTVQEFVDAESYLRAFHEKHGQKHVRFYYPEGEMIPDDLKAYLEENKHNIGFLELFAIDPAHFLSVSPNPDIAVQKVTSEILDVYLKFQYPHDATYGQGFAEQKQALYERNFNSEKIQQIIALYKGQSAGTVDVIISEETAEIDSLIVAEEFQRKGIGSRLQKFVMELFPTKTIILVADGEDTPKDMYRKQNYQYLNYQYESFKVY
ncbi:GNAT family N-acetyltransferase [Pseudoneobacillus sp. C159]